jgi:ATP/maltotriose-dependent transcriptional regulator MalT
VNLLGAPTEHTIARLFEVSKARGFDHGMVSAYRAAAQAAACSNDLEGAERWVDEGLRLADNRQLDQYLHTHILKTYRVELDQLRGHWSGAERNFQKLIQTGHAHWSVRMIILRLRVCPMYIRAGRDEARQWLEEALAVESKLTPIEAYSLHRALVEYHWLAGDLDAARRSVHDLHGSGWGASHPRIRGDMALCSWITGDLDHEPENIAEPYALSIGGDWRAAAGAWKRLGCPYEAGFSLIFGDEDA